MGMGRIRVGTSGWSYKDWVSVFYPPGTRAGDYLSVYAEHFAVVEVDSTYYRIPSARTVQGWRHKTPADFRFAVKAPGVVTHEKMLEACDAEWDEFRAALAPLGDKLHSVLLQFSYFNKKAFATAGKFFQRLDRFLANAVRDYRLAVEIRNKSWLGGDFFELLRGHRVAYALTEHVWMPPVEQVLEGHDCVTGDFVYLRLIGDRYGIEKLTQTWDKTVIDRGQRLRSIVKALAKVVPAADVVAFINNHYAGHAPASCEDFLKAMADAGMNVGD